MTHHRRRGASRPAAECNMEETKEHVMAAGKELLLAARGALFFCKDYVEAQVPEASRPNLLGFFQKAIAVADELSRGIAGVSTIKRTAAGIAKPLFTAMEREMREEAAEGKKQKTQGPRKTRRRYCGSLREGPWRVERRLEAPKTAAVNARRRKRRRAAGV